MSTTNHQIHVPPARPVRCFRHHVSMAACDGCRRVRAEQLARRREAGGTRPPS